MYLKNVFDTYKKATSNIIDTYRKYIKNFYKGIKWQFINNKLNFILGV